MVAGTAHTRLGCLLADGRGGDAGDGAPVHRCAVEAARSRELVSPLMAPVEPPAVMLGGLLDPLAGSSLRTGLGSTAPALQRGRPAAPAVAGSASPRVRPARPLALTAARLSAVRPAPARSHAAPALPGRRRADRPSPARVAARAAAVPGGAAQVTGGRIAAWIDDHHEGARRPPAPPATAPPRGASATLPAGREQMVAPSRAAGASASPPALAEILDRLTGSARAAAAAAQPAGAPIAPVTATPAARTSASGAIARAVSRATEGAGAQRGGARTPSRRAHHGAAPPQRPAVASVATLAAALERGATRRAHDELGRGPSAGVEPATAFAAGAVRSAVGPRDHRDAAGFGAPALLPAPGRGTDARPPAPGRFGASLREAPAAVEWLDDDDALAGRLQQLLARQAQARGIDLS